MHVQCGISHPIDIKGSRLKFYFNEEMGIDISVGEIWESIENMEPMAYQWMEDVPDNVLFRNFKKITKISGSKFKIIHIYRPKEKILNVVCRGKLKCDGERYICDFSFPLKYFTARAGKI